MAEHDIPAIVRNCNRFLSYNAPISVRDRLMAIAESPLALEKGDHYGRGGVVSQLEQECAELFGKEAAVFMPSGVMAQLIAVRIWSDLSGTPRIAFHPTCHLEIHEESAYRHLHNLEAICLGEADRLFTLQDLEKLDQPISTLLIELPQREIGGALPSWEELVAICGWARARNIRLHLDGARVWECAPFYGKTYADIAALFDSVYVSFYKVIAGLPGAMLMGPADFIQTARVWQRRRGGNLHQQSPSAIAAKLGMEHHLPQIPLYVAKAAEFAAVLREFDRIRVVPEYPPTNMMHLYFEGDRDQLVKSALQIAKEERVGLFFALGDRNKLEVSVNEGALDLTGDDIRRLFTRLFSNA